MNKQRAGYLIAGALSVSALFWGTRHFTTRGDSAGRASETVTLTNQEAAAPAALPQGPMAQANPNQEPAATAPVEEKNPLEDLSPGLVATLEEYAKLKQKVLLNAESEAAKKRILQDEKLLGELKAVFDFVPDPKRGEQQNLQYAAIDLLLEARAAGSETAAAVLRSLIEDPRVEKDELSNTVRAELAETKAEVMYRWSSQEPERAAEIEKWLPGPVSAKIWHNVLSAQKQNQLESLAEASAAH